MGLYFKRRKRILKKFLIGASLFLIGAAAVYFFSLLFRRFLPVSFTQPPWFFILVMTLVTLIAYKPLDFAVAQFFKHFLFRKKSYSHITLMNLTEDLRLILDLNELTNLIVNTFGEVLHLKTVALITPNRVRGDFEIASAYGWNLSVYRRIRLSEDSPLIQWIQKNGPHVLVRDRVMQSLAWKEANRMNQDFESLRAGWVIPLFIKDDLIGTIAFSAPGPEKIFDETDFQFFREFADSIAKSVHNALTVQELKVANTELQDVQSQLLQVTKLTAIGQLATGIAHEIHNPLTIISGKAQILLLQKDRNHLDERVEEVLKTIVKQTKRAADITRKLLMFSQSSGSPKELLHLEQVLEDTIALVSYQTSLEGIEITKMVGGGTPPFYANIHELREVFLNLMLNAVQSIGSHGKIHVELTYLPADQIIEIQISDTGKGIRAEHIDKLFNPFFTTRHDAVGLGLFVTKQIVHRYGGSIRVESRPDQGSLFIVRFPYHEPSGPVASPEGVSLSLFPAEDR